MPARKFRILMVSYGGMHVHMVASFANFLKAHTGDHFNLIGLTMAKKIFAEQYDLKALGFSDFLNLLPEKSLHYGKGLLQELQSNPLNNIISKDESEAYLGASFVELMNSLGSEKQAFDQYAKQGRACFLPVKTMGKIIDFYQPDYVLTTNSPRCEQAAQIAAQHRGIPTGIMVDLFGVYERYPLCARHIFVMNEAVKNNLIRKYHVNEQSIFITGNPYFETFLSAVPYNEQKKTDMGFSQSKTVLLWVDRLSLRDDQKGHFRRSEKHIFETLDRLIQISRKHNLSLAYRPHPSQNTNTLQKLIDESDGVMKNVAGFDLLDTLQAADYVGGFFSSVLVHAKLMKKITLQLNVTGGENPIPLANNRDSFEFRGFDEMDDFFQQADSASQLNTRETTSHDQPGSANKKIYDIVASALND